MQPNVSMLLVEGEALQAFALKDALEDGGYAVIAASSGAAAMEALPTSTSARDQTDGRWLATIGS